MTGHSVVSEFYLTVIHQSSGFSTVCSGLLLESLITEW